jgi:hypothetical protein
MRAQSLRFKQGKENIAEIAGIAVLDEKKEIFFR